MIYLTILNTLAIIYLILSGKGKYYIEVNSDKTFGIKTLLGYRVTLWRVTGIYSAKAVFNIYIPIRNRRKTELRDEIARLMRPNNPNRRYSLSCIFSWLKTWEEVRQFEKNYSVVDSKYVQELVSKFVPKTEEKD